MARLPPSDRATAGHAFEIASATGLFGVAVLAAAVVGWKPIDEWAFGDSGPVRGISAAPEAAAEDIAESKPLRKVVLPEGRTHAETQVARESAPNPGAKELAPSGAPPEKGYAVPRTKTPVNELEIVQILRDAHRLELGEAPTDLRLGVAWAHISLEHQRGKAVECNNFGNLSVWEREPGPHYVRILKERRRASYNSSFGGWRWVEMRFRAFDSPTDGARAYWRHLQDHYAKALRLFSVGNGYDAGLKLARDGYATANPTPYADSVSNLAGEFKLRILPQL